MDPVSLAASIITLAAAASNTGAALQRLWELKQASENLSVIINEVTEFELVLAFVLEAVTSLQSPEHDRATKTLQIFLDRAEVQIKDIKDFVQAQLACTDVGKFDAHTKPKMKKRGKLKEILGENQRKLEPLRQQLVSTKLGLLIALSAMNVRHISQIPALLMSIQQIQVVNPGGSMLSSTTDNFLPPATRVEEILSTYPLDPTGAISTTVSDAPGTSQIPTSARDDDQPPAELPEETHPPTPGSPHRAAAIPTPPSLNTAGQQSPGTNTSTTILPSTGTPKISGSYLAIQTKLMQRNCPPWCPCQCHIPFQVSTPQWLRGLFGGLFFRLRGAPVLSRQACNSPRCGTSSSKATSVQFQYYFPLWLLPLGISVTGSWKDLRGQGATWTFNIPRAITSVEHHNRLIYIIEHGTVDYLKQYMAVNQIAAIDIFELDGLHLFEYAVMRDRQDIYSMLLQNGASLSIVNRTGWTYGQYLFQTLLTKCQNWNEIPEPLEADDSDNELDHLGFTLLHKGVLRLTDHTLASCIDSSTINVKDIYGFTPLHWAARRGDTKTVQLLLEAGADPNATCKKGKTSLIWAAELASVACCRALLAAEADFRIADSEDKTALHLAATIAETAPISALEIARVLLEHGLEINSQDKYRRTCLIYAAQHGSAGLCELLLSYCADIEVTDIGGFSAVFWAVQYNHAAVVKLLRDRGARLNRLTKRGHSLVHLAATYGGVEVMQILREARIQGLRMGPEEEEKYWSYFDYLRNENFFGQRAPIEIEAAGFELLLQSVIPSNEPIIDNTPSIPGAFPEDDDSCSNADTESDASVDDELSDDEERETDPLPASQITEQLGIDCIENFSQAVC